MTDSSLRIDPKHAALLVMDYQPAVLGSVNDTEELLSRVAEAIAIVRRHGGQVGYVRIAFDDADYEAVPTHSPFAPALTTARDALHTGVGGTGDGVVDEEIVGGGAAAR